MGVIETCLLPLSSSDAQDVLIRDAARSAKIACIARELIRAMGA
jgi:hypothetical protein